MRPALETARRGPGASMRRRLRSRCRRTAPVPACTTSATNAPRAFASVGVSLALHAALLAAALVWARSRDERPSRRSPVEVEIVVERGAGACRPRRLAAIAPPQEPPPPVAETSPAPEPTPVRDATPTPEPTPTPTAEPRQLGAHAYGTPEATPTPEVDAHAHSGADAHGYPGADPDAGTDAAAPRPPTRPASARSETRPAAHRQAEARRRAERRRAARRRPGARRSPPNPLAAVRAAAGEYQNAVLARINAYKRYPDIALERGARGIAIVRFTLDEWGQVVAAALVKSRGTLRSTPMRSQPCAAPRPFAPPPRRRAANVIGAAQLRPPMSRQMVSSAELSYTCGRL